MAVVTMRQLLESGVHFGHQTRRWNPKMKRFIFTERNGIYIIDLQRSLSDIDRAFEFVKETVAHGGSVLFVGTKKQAQEPVAEQAGRVGMPYVNQRWLGGMLTNFGTVHKRLQRLKELEEIDFDDVAGSALTKKELLVLKREKDKLERSLGGIRDMAKVPSAVWVIDTKKEHLAVAEARKLKIPVIAILDTNCDPDEVDYGIPGNDDAIRSVALLTRVIADAVAEGLVARHSGTAGARGGADVEPLAEWERELLAAEVGTDAATPGLQTSREGVGDMDEASEAGAPAGARQPGAGRKDGTIEPGLPAEEAPVANEPPAAGAARHAPVVKDAAAAQKAAAQDSADQDSADQDSADKDSAGEDIVDQGTANEDVVDQYRVQDDLAKQDDAPEQDALSARDAGQGEVPVAEETADDATPVEAGEPAVEAVPSEDAWPVSAAEPVDDAEPVPGTDPVIGAEATSAEEETAVERQSVDDSRPSPGAAPHDAAEPATAKPSGRRRAVDEA